MTLAGIVAILIFLGMMLYEVMTREKKLRRERNVRSERIIDVDIEAIDLVHLVELIGIYHVSGQKDVHLIELGIKTNHANVDIGQITQMEDWVDPLDWQIPWDEKFLNTEGTKTTEDGMDSSSDNSDYTRLTFFLHYVDFHKPLITQFGALELKNPEIMPERISSIIEYEQP